MRNQPNETALGIDIGGTKVFLGLIDRKGQILYSHKYPMHRGQPEEIFQNLATGIDRLLECTNTFPMALGIGLKGHVDAESKQILSSSLIEMNGTYDLCAPLTTRYGIPAAIDNDVNAATLAEAALGAGKVESHFVYVNIGTGSAIGVYENGRLMRGRDNNYGEIGYTLCRRPRDEGGLFCLEDVASGKGLDQEIRRLRPHYPSSILQERIKNEEALVDAISIFDAYQKGDPLAIRAVDNALETLALSIWNFEFLLNCGVYIFGGGIVNDPWFFAKLQDKVEQIRRLMKLRMPLKMRMSDLGASNVGLLGAASIAFSVLEKNFKN